MMSDSTKKKIRPKRLLYLQLIFAALAFFAMVLLSYLFMRDTVQRHLMQNAESVLFSVREHIDIELNEPRMNLAALAQTVRHMILRGDDRERIQTYFNDISEHMLYGGQRHSSFNGLFGYINTVPDGQVLIECSQWVRPDNSDYESHLWYRNAMAAGGEIADTLMYTDIISGSANLTYSLCLYDDENRCLGVIAQRLRIDVIGDIVVDTSLALGGYGILFDRDLIVIAHANPEFKGMSALDLTLPISAYADAMLAGTDIVARPLKNWKGEESIVFVQKLANGWYLGLQTPKKPFFQSVTRMAFVLSALGSALAAALILVLIRIDAARKRSDTESMQKSIFLARMSHEMRTPLNAIVGLSELCLGSGSLDGENFPNVEKINNAGMSLLSTVNDILDISKIEAGKFKLIPVEYDIPSLINDVVAQNILRIREKPVNFVLTIDEKLPTRLYGDDIRIRQILNNLMSNAFKYTMEGTVELSIGGERGGGDIFWLNASVRDTGRGIKPEDQKILFIDYSQVDMELNRRIEGTGLGLPISKKVVEMMDGTISVKSEYGKGSIFTVNIKQKFLSDAFIGPEVVKNLKEFRHTETRRIRNSNLLRIRIPYARVLIVDDVETNLDVARGMMKPYGMQIDCVSSGREAVDIVRAEEIRYSAIFMDHMMPGMDGMEAVRIIREEIGTDYARTIPIIALTANAIVGNEPMFLSSGFQAFLSKPIDIVRLDSVIRQWVRNRETEKQYAYMKIDGLDAGRGIERFGGDPESYVQVLRSYVLNTLPLLKAIKAASENNRADYAVTVHGIKGSSRGICAWRIGDSAEALEKAAREGNWDFVSSHNGELVRELEKLLDGLGGALAGSEDPRPKKDWPGRDVLARLLAACEAYRMDDVDAAMEEIDRYEYSSDDGLAAWLRENINRMNFTGIIEKLTDTIQATRS